MFSKSCLKQGIFASFVVLSSILFISCSNDEIKEDSGVVVNLAYDTSCFDEMSVRWKGWADGHGHEEIVKSDFNCIIDGISYFLLRVRGENIGSYSSQEIFNFTEKFFKSAAIKKSSIDDFLVVKSWLLGGSNLSVSFEELNKISWFLKSSVNSVKLLTPSAEKVFFKEAVRALTDEDAINIKMAITSISREFKVLTSAAKTPFSIIEFESLLNRLFDDFDLKRLGTEDIQPLWNIVSLATGKAPRAHLSLSPSEGVSELAFHALYIAVRFKYGVSDIGFRNINSQIHLESVIGEVFGMLKTMVNLQPNQVFSQLRLNNLSVELLSLLDLDFEVTESWVDGILTAVLKDYLKTSIFGAKEIETLALEWQDFKDFSSQTLVLQGLGFEGSLATNLVLLSDINKRTLDYAWPMLSNDKGYVLNPLKNVEIFADYGNLFTVNWQRALTAVFLKSYAEDRERREKFTGVTIQELEKGYAVVFKALNAIDYLADDNEGSWFRIFNEANLFVPRATADTVMSFEEGIDFFGLLFSGITFSGDLFDAMSAACPDQKKSCQLDWFRNTREETWGEFAPEFTNYLKTIDKAEWEIFTGGFEQMARETIQDKPFVKSELLRVAIAIQYIEIFLRKYDTDSNLKIDFSETVHSFDRFKAALLALPQVKGTEAENDPSTLLALYTFFLRNGRLPRQSFGQYVELLGWRSRVRGCITQTPEGSFIASKPQACVYESSRGNLMKILAFLSNSI